MNIKAVLWAEHIPKNISHQDIYKFRGMHLCKQIKRSVVTHCLLWLCGSWVNIYLYNDQWICPLKFSFVVRCTPYIFVVNICRLFGPCLWFLFVSYINKTYQNDSFSEKINKNCKRNVQNCSNYIDCLWFKWWWSTKHPLSSSSTFSTNHSSTFTHLYQSPLTTPLYSHIFINFH